MVILFIPFSFDQKLNRLDGEIYKCEYKIKIKEQRRFRDNKQSIGSRSSINFTLLSQNSQNSQDANSKFIYKDTNVVSLKLTHLATRVSSTGASLEA